MTNEDLLDALRWIRHVAQANHDLDPDLRSRGARTLRRIVKRADEAIDKYPLDNPAKGR